MEVIALAHIYILKFVVQQMSTKDRIILRATMHKYHWLVGYHKNAQLFLSLPKPLTIEAARHRTPIEPPVISKPTSADI